MSIYKKIKIKSALSLVFMALGIALLFMSCDNAPKRPAPVDPGTPPVVDVDTTTNDKPDTPDDSDTGEDKGDFDRDTVKVDPPKVDPPKEKPKDYSFRLDPDKYGIVQGKINDAQSLKNRFALEKALNEASAKKCDTFFTGTLDAYFDVYTVTSENGRFQRWVEAVNIPAGLIVNATGATLRVQPGNAPSYALFCMYQADNAQLLGGTIIGERNAHTYSGSSTDEWGHCLAIQASKNVLVDGVTAKHGNGDGLSIYARGHTWEDFYTPSRNVTVRNCKFIENRRQGISITDGYDIIVEKNLFLRTGIDTPTSKGTLPKCGIDVEAYRGISEKTGEPYQAEIVDGVIIRGNTEYGSANVAFNVHTGDNVLIENNKVETGIVYQNTYGTVIRNNRIIDTSGNGRVGIGGGSPSETNKDNEVYGNYISGQENGIDLNYHGHNVHDNVVENCRTGLRLHWVKDSKIYNNKSTSQVSNGYGLLAYYRSLDNVTVYDNYFESVRNALRLEHVNTGTDEGENTFSMIDNDFVSPQPAWLDSVKNGTFRGNTFDNGVVITNSENITMTQNTVSAKKRSGIQIRKGNKNIELDGNDITADWECVDVQAVPEGFVNQNNCK